MAKGITLQELDVATVHRLIVKDDLGRAKVAAPAAADDIALKSTVDNAVGSLSTLLTSSKTNTVTAINELFSNVSNGKASIAAAITDMGVVSSGGDSFSVLAQKIKQINTGRRFASGSAIVNTSGHLIISGLSFVPQTVFWFYSTSGYPGFGFSSRDTSLNIPFPPIGLFYNGGEYNFHRSASFTSNGVTLILGGGSSSIQGKYIVFE